MFSDNIFSSRMRRLAAAAFVFFFAISSASGSEADDQRALRDLATQIKAVVEGSRAGQSVSVEQINQFRREIDAYSKTQSANSVTREKLQAVEQLFGMLRQYATLGFGERKQPTKRSDFDPVTIVKGRGDSCKTALGLGDVVPVRVPLASTNSSYHDAWFRFETAQAGNVRISTDSLGSDPSLAAFSSCDDKKALASNDDTIGLDAAVDLRVTTHQVVFIHLTNSGSNGIVDVSASVASTGISGQITDAITHVQLGGATVSVYDTSGNYYTSIITDNNGLYTATLNSPGFYYVRADDYNHASAMYPNALCNPRFNDSYYDGIGSCDIAHAQYVSVGSGSTIPGVNIALGLGQKITGTLRNAAGNPVDGSVSLYDSSGQLYTTVNTYGGPYTFPYLAPGSFRIVGQSSAYGWQVYNHIACTGTLQTQCDPVSGTPIVISNHDISGVDLNLPTLGSIEGTVTGIDSQPISSCCLGDITVVDTLGNILAQGTVGADGRFSVGPLGVGAFYIYAGAGGYFQQIYDNVDCGTDCFSSASSAKTVSLNSVGAVGHASFSLHPLPTIHGHIQDATGGYPLSNVTVYVTSNLSVFYYSDAATDGYGNYSVTGTVPGTYYVWAQSNDHVDQVYSGVPCEKPDYFAAQTYNCNLTDATPVTIAPGQTPPAFDFALDLSSSISGTATVRVDGPSGLPMLNIGITLYDSSATQIAATTTDAYGHFSFLDLAPGTYFALAQASISEEWKGIDCQNGQCLPAEGTPIQVGPHSIINGIDFDLLRRDAVVGQVVDTEGGPVAGVFIDIFDAQDGSYFNSGVTNGQGYYAAAGVVGNSYLVATNAGDGFFNQVYPAISCASMTDAYDHTCSLTGGTTIGLSNAGNQPRIANFVLKSTNTIFIDGFELH